MWHDGRPGLVIYYPFFLFLPGAHQSLHPAHTNILLPSGWETKPETKKQLGELLVDLQTGLYPTLQMKLFLFFSLPLPRLCVFYLLFFPAARDCISHEQQ